MRAPHPHRIARRGSSRRRWWEALLDVLRIAAALAPLAKALLDLVGSRRPC